MSDKVRIEEISIIIPVKNNQKGIDTFLTTFFETQTSGFYPKEIIIVDNNSAVPVIIQKNFIDQGLNIEVFKCARKGPASARNLGAKQSSGKWLLFIDSDCIPTKTTISGYLDTKKNAVAYVGAVDALESDHISSYYWSQKIHRPPETIDSSGRIRPKYLVTANVMIEKEAFQEVNGFDEFFIFACEDIDMGIRLTKVGQLEFIDEAIVLHDYHDGLSGFVRRFFEYGKGNRIIRQKHSLHLFPMPFLPKEKSQLVNYPLATIQWLCLLTGYALAHFKLRIKGLSISICYA